MAPPFQIGDKMPLTNISPISTRSSLPSFGTSLKVRFVLPSAVNKPHMARMAVTFAHGMYLRPGNQSSGRAQYTKKNALSQKKADFVGSAIFVTRRHAGNSAASVTLSPIATKTLFRQPQNHSYLLRAPPQQHRLNRLKHDQQVEPDGSVFDVEKVVLQLFAGILDRAAVLISDLRRPSDPRPHHMPHAGKRYFFREQRDELRPLRARADKRHIAFQHAPHLRNLIESRSAQKLPRTRHPRIIVPRPLCPIGSLSVLPHGAEFHHLEKLAALTHPRLRVENRPLGIEANGEHDQGQQRQRKGQANQRNKKRDHAAHHDKKRAAAKTVPKYEPAGIKILDLDLVRHLLQPRGRFLDLDSLRAQLK